jgi:hypothetical protein
VDAEGRLYPMRGGHPSAELPRLTFERLREPMVASGVVSDGRVDEAIELLSTPGVAIMSHVMMAAWGRRPMG